MRLHKTYIKGWIMISALLLTGPLSAHDIEGFVRRQMQTYPKLRLLDIYKSCLQDYLGPEHLLADKQRAKAYLDEELQTTELADLPTWYFEPCGTDSCYYRVGLRTVKEGIISDELLLNAFIRSADSDSRPSVQSWCDRWHKIVGRIDRMHITLPYYEQDRQTIDSILSAGHYAISHSPEYRQAYHPHYRIVARHIFEQDIKPLIQKAMIVRIAEIEVHPEYLADYLTAAKDVGAMSVRREPGVVCIFPMQMEEDSCQIRIVEIYRSKAAYEHHLTTPHFLTYKQSTLHMVKSLKLHDQNPLDAASMSLIFKKME